MSTSRGTTVAFSTFSSIFDAASKEYKKKTGQDLQAHPLAAELDHCDSPDAILKVLQKQADALDDSDQPLMKWLSPTVNLLFLFSAALGEGLTLVSFSKLVFPVSPFINILFQPFPAGKVIFTGIGVLLGVNFSLGSFSHIPMTPYLSGC
jgi:hypothetical protein